MDFFSSFSNSVWIWKNTIFLENVKNLDHHEEKDKIIFSPTI